MSASEYLTPSQRDMLTRFRTWLFEEIGTRISTADHLETFIFIQFHRTNGHEVILSDDDETGLMLALDVYRQFVAWLGANN